jgi:hypothetical protein
MKAASIPEAARLYTSLTERTRDRDRFQVERFGETVIFKVDAGAGTIISGKESVERLVTTVWKLIEEDCESVRERLRELGVTEFD